MSSVTFVGILSELMPSGVLPQLAAGLGVADTRIGFLVGVYALASAVFAIPVVSATLAVNRKTLLIVLLVGFAVSNIVFALSPSYSLMVACRILGGVCAGVMWPMIAAYGTRLVPDNMQGRAITIIMAGNTLGISIGMPVMTTIGVSFGWRAEFMVLGLVIAAIAALSHFVLPAVAGEKLSKSNSPLAVLRNRGILIVLLLTFLTVMAHYSIYTYITLLVEKIRFPGGIGMALLFFGVGSIISVFGSAKYVDAHLRGLIESMLVTGAVAMALFLVFAGTPGVSHVAFFLWGIAFGPLVSMYQAAVSKLVDEAKDVATSVQSSVFNFSIMIATWIGGLLLTQLPESGVKGIVVLSLACFVAAIVVAFVVSRTMRASSPAVVKS
ncbi:MAG: MFS transporter [Proteobacteria bacterium]|nr:MFS transporter [Pseudomonadota bacterium]